MILYINCCVRSESRTDRLGKALLEKLGGQVTELNLYEEDLRPLDIETLYRRMALTAKGDFSNRMFDYAKQFASADTIVIAAPFWDLSFPAMLKTYIENIYVIGIVSDYDENGIPHGLCRAKQLWYVTTAGGRYEPAFSYGYISSLVHDYFGIQDTRLIKAENLDIPGYDAEKILDKAISEL